MQHRFNMHFAQAQTHNDKQVRIILSRIYGCASSVLRHPICAKIPIPADRLVIFANNPNVTK